MSSKRLMDYTELVKDLRLYMNDGTDDLRREAADAIEQLSKRLDNSIPKGDAEIIISEVSKPKWMPVTERLPEHDKNVLICYEWTGRSGTVYREVGIASIEELERDPAKMFRPLYWMPLPEPPKEDERC